MANNKRTSVFRDGFWIKEQQGVLTMGALKKGASEVMVIPDDLQATLFEMEADVIDALYGETSVPFEAEFVNVANLLKNLEKEFPGYSLKVSYSEGENEKFTGDYETLHTILSKFIQNSFSASDEDEQPIAYLNVSLIDHHLSIIYRDTLSICNPGKLKKVITYIKENLKGEIQYKEISNGKSYFDILIPSQR